MVPSSQLKIGQKYKGNGPKLDKKLVSVMISITVHQFIYRFLA